MTAKTTTKAKRSYAVALHQAQMQVKSIGKDSRNDFNKFNYTSAEHMIAETRAVLHDCGLVVEPTETMHSMVGSQLMVGRGFRVTEITTGDSHEYVVEIPVCERKGTPYDKASLGSQTTALNYFLRDLLLIPRVEEEVCAKNDTAPRPKLSAQAATSAQIAAVSDLLNEADDPIEAKKRTLAWAGVSSIDKISSEKAAKLLQAKK
jgi:hypothetical protein|tara:strand:+ start:999 stop:1613 length:615 start_codon:yes stop_codon:yes gene_type:complete